MQEVDEPSFTRGRTRPDRVRQSHRNAAVPDSVYGALSKAAAHRQWVRVPPPTQRIARAKCSSRRALRRRGRSTTGDMSRSDLRKSG